MADKPVLVSVTSVHTISGFFETFFEHASRTKLRRKTKIVFFGPTDQKLWVFEVSRRSQGRAGMCWSQPARVDHLHKKWRAGRKNISRKMGIAPQARAAGRHLCLWDSSHFFEIYLFKKKRIFGSLGDGPGLLGEWVYSTPIF
jgi:hypothetical protein